MGRCAHSSALRRESKIFAQKAISVKSAGSAGWIVVGTIIYWGRVREFEVM